MLMLLRTLDIRRCWDEVRTGRFWVETKDNEPKDAFTLCLDAVVQATVKYNRQIMQADEAQDAFTLHAHVEPTESCTTNQLRVCVKLVMKMFLRTRRLASVKM